MVLYCIGRDIVLVEVLYWWRYCMGGGIILVELSYWLVWYGIVSVEWFGL